MMETFKHSTEKPAQLDDFCRLCLFRKPDLRPLSSQIQTMLIPEMLFKVTGALINMHDQLPRVICERCLMKLELAYSIADEFRRQEDLLRSLWWKGALVDELVVFQRSEESRRKPYSEEVIERLAVVHNVTIPDHQDQIKVEQQKTTTVDDQLQIVKSEPELFEATEFSIQVLPDDSVDECVGQTEWKQEPNAIIDKGLEMVLELEDLRTIGALPDELLEQLDMQQTTNAASDEALSGEEEQSDDDNDTDYVPHNERWVSLASFAGSKPDDEEGLFRCEICNKPYDTKDEANEHRLSRHKSDQKPWKFECKYCQQRFDRAIKKERHEKNHEKRLATELNQGPYECPICFKSVLSKHSFNGHMQRHELIKKGKFRCKVCDRIFASMSELRRHEQTHELTGTTRDNIPPPILIKIDNETVYKCGECHHISANNVKYVQHAQRHIIRKTGMFQCQDCGNRYVIKNNLLQHQLNVHKLSIDPEPAEKETNVSNKPASPVEIDKRLPHCSECDAFFLSKADYKIHLSVHESGSNQKTSVSVKSEPAYGDCQQLEVVAPEESSMAVPSTSVELDGSMSLGSVWKCDECGESVTLRTRTTCQDHKRKHEIIRNVTQKCEICKIAFSARTALWRHRQENHGLISQKDGPTEQCPLCKKQIPKHKLQRHNKTHENISLRKYVCVKCDTALGTPHHLKSHVKSGTCENPRYVPTMAEALTTEALQEFFSWGDNQRSGAKSPMIIEVQNGHFKCKECDKLLKNFASASKHARRHRLLKAGVYTCGICKKVFGAKSVLNRHIGTVHLK